MANENIFLSRDYRNYTVLLSVERVGSEKLAALHSGVLVLATGQHKNVAAAFVDRLTCRRPVLFTSGVPMVRRLPCDNLHVGQVLFVGMTDFMACLVRFSCLRQVCTSQGRLQRRGSLPQVSPGHCGRVERPPSLPRAFLACICA